MKLVSILISTLIISSLFLSGSVTLDVDGDSINDTIYSYTDPGFTISGEFCDGMPPEFLSTIIWTGIGGEIYRVYELYYGSYIALSYYIYGTGSQLSYTVSRSIYIGPNMRVAKMGGREIDTETFASYPTDKTRKKIGVGEEVELTLNPGASSPSNVSWVVSGSGSLSAPTGNQVVFTAHERASDPTIYATYDGRQYSVSFDVVEPAGAYVINQPGEGIYHIQGKASAGFLAKYYFTPEDVSFYNVQFKEGGGTAVGFDFYSNYNGITHTPTSQWIDIKAGTSQRPNELDGTDEVTVKPQGPPYYGLGTWNWDIELLFRVGTGNSKQFGTINSGANCSTTGTTDRFKTGSFMSVELNSPTSIPGWFTP